MNAITSTQHDEQQINPDAHQKSCLQIHIDTGNAAFEDEGEIPRIMREIANRVEQGSIGGKVKDGNGNTCGTFSIHN